MTFSQTTTSGTTDPDTSVPSQPSQARAAWQRAGGVLLVTGGVSLALKFALLLAFHPDPIPRFLVAPGESVLITLGLICTYAGATALVIPVLGRRPAWALALATPIAVVGYILVANTLMALGNALATSADNPVLRNETGVLLYAIVSAAVGTLLLRLRVSGNR